MKNKFFLADDILEAINSVKKTDKIVLPHSYMFESPFHADLPHIFIDADGIFFENVNSKKVIDGSEEFFEIVNTAFNPILMTVCDERFFNTVARNIKNLLIIGITENPNFIPVSHEFHIQAHMKRYGDIMISKNPDVCKNWASDRGRAIEFESFDKALASIDKIMKNIFDVKK